jgi:hypothetical protein
VELGGAATANVTQLLGRHALARWTAARDAGVGVWDDDDLFWFSSSVRSRKALSIANDPRCTVATEDEQHPVVLNGDGEIRTSRGEIAHVIELVNAKYATDHGTGFLDPAKNATIRGRPRWALGLDADDFTGSPTRWTFE